MDRKSDDRIVWITGASSGIGKGLALAYARKGAKVAISARSEGRLEELAAENPDNIFAFPVDVTDAGAVAKCVTDIEQKLGPIDQAILNAGTYTETPIDNFDPEIVERTMMVNVVGVANAVAPLMKTMRARRSGRIAIMASVAGYRGLPRAAAYCGSKAALIAMAQSLKAELDSEGVTMQVICPGFVKTPLTEQNSFDMPYLMDVDDAVARVMAGLETDTFEIAFPKRFAWQLKMMQKLPDALYFPMIKKATGL